MLGGKKKRGEANSTFHVGIVSRDKKVIQKGSLEATPNSLVFTDGATQTKYSWSLKSLRKIEARDKLFVIETSDISSSLSDEGIFSFSTSKAKQLQNLVSHYMNALIESDVAYEQIHTNFDPPLSISQTTEETIPTHWQLNTRLSMESSSSVSPTYSRLSSVPRDIFEVEKIENSCRKELGRLEVFDSEVVFVVCGGGGGGGGKRIAWPIKCLRRFGYDGDVFTLEVGRKAPGGEGLHNFKTSRPAELNIAVKSASVSTRGGSTPPSPRIPENSGKVYNQHYSFTSPAQRGPLPPLPSQPPLSLPPPPSQTPLSLPPSQTPLPPPPSQPPLPLPPSPPQSSHHHHGNHQSSPKLWHENNIKRSQSPPTFSRSDSLVRRAYSAFDLRQNVFEVRNISDDKEEVGQGTLEVTSTDLIYIDSHTDEKWKWPFKFLRKYGFEGNIFSFEAGRRCPGGQGLYAFASERANEIHETIVENICGRGKNEGGPARASVTPENISPAKGVPMSRSRLSLVDDQATPSLVKLTNKNHYNIDTSPNLLMRSRPLPVQPVSPDRVPSHPVPVTMHSTARSVSSSSSDKESSVTPPNSARFVGVDSSLTAGNPSSNNPITSQMQLVKPVMEPVKPVTREHHYDVPANYGQESNRRVPSGQRSVSAAISVINEKPAKRKQSSDQKKRSNSSAAIASDKEMKKQNSKSDLKLERRRSEQNLQVPDTFEKKTRSSMLSRLRGKKKKMRKEYVDDLIDGSSSHSIDEGSENGGRDMYVNIGQLRKLPHSASCDDILSSCNSSDSHSTTASAVPLPQLHHSQTPPTSRRHMENEFQLQAQNSVPASSTSAIVYQNLNDMRTRDERSHSQPIQAPPTISDPPSNSSIDQSRFYSNLPLLTKTDQPSHNGTMYTEIEIRQPPSVSADILPDLQSSPQPSFSCTNGGVMPKRTPPFIKQKLLPKISPKPNLYRSRSLFPSATPESDLSSRNRSQSELISEDLNSTSKLDVNGDVLVTSVEINEPVQYAPLDFLAMNAVAQIKRDHMDIRNFDELLGRHDIREMEMDGKKKRNVVT